MPSPIGHVLGGMAGGWLIGGGSSVSRTTSPWADAAVFGIVGALADIDFLLGIHSQYTHSLGACGVVFAATLVWLRGSVRLALAATAAYGSHLLLDWLGHDGAPPIGIMALWPFTSTFYQSDLHWFMAISRRYWLSGFWPHNLHAVAHEIAILGPITGLIWWWRARPNPSPPFHFRNH
ncbi:MAG: hypothetical protein HYZ58_08485 [Acidobacteria bacterium]|nr:hypothetical protein [Acidobacteriota bacterium]MBI3263175.1 hypothetical protein [Acidobacteriota bacterium]